MREQVVGHACRAVDRNGEAESDRATAGRIDRAVHAYDLSRSVDERTTRITGVDRCIGLDHVHVGAIARIGGRRDEIASHTTDDSDSDTWLGIREHEAVRIADGDRPLTDDQR